MHHSSTAEQRVQWISQLLVPEPAHGLVSQLSRSHEVSRQTLYRWKEKGTQALQAALELRQDPPKRRMQVQERVLTLLIEALMPPDSAVKTATAPIVITARTTPYSAIV